MSNHIQPGLYKLTPKMGGDEVMICVDKSQFGYTGANPLCGFKTKHPHTPMMWNITHIANVQDGPLPERPTMYIATHDRKGRRFPKPFITNRLSEIYSWRKDGYTIERRPWPDELMDLWENDDE